MKLETHTPVSLGEPNLRAQLAHLAPRLEGEPRVFRPFPGGDPLPGNAVMVFRDAEGLSMILEVDVAAPGETVWAQITFGLQASRDPSRVLAIITSQLAGHGIPCNIVSSFYHDHLFVEWDLADATMDVLMSLVQQNAP
jgi:hypothetical protein